MDWKEALAKMASDEGLDLSAVSSESKDAEHDENKELSSRQRGKLHVVKERKGRAGKVATIIEGFTCDDDTLQQIAGQLKKRLGTGGSARGGEILIQGDMQDKVKTALIEMGFKC